MVIDYDSLLDSVVSDKIVDVSATTVALSLSAINLISTRYNWVRNNQELNSTEWDYIDSIISLAMDELMSTLVGLIVPAIFASASINKFLACDGSVYDKTSYPLLYDVLDSQYIISGTQFRVPDFRNRSLVGAGESYVMGDIGGIDDVILTTNEMPNHSHSFTSPTFGIDIESVGVPDPTGVGNPPVTFTTSAVGGGQAHENRSPFYAINFYVVAG